MTLQRFLACLVALVLLVAPSSAGLCPTSCICTTTRDGLHRAACSNVAELYKHTLRQKHHNINILDLSHNNITKLTHELDRLTEVVTLDLSTNGIKELNKFLHNAKKLVHLNLANNRIEKLSLSHIPTSISSLDLTNNIMCDVPSDLRHLQGLEHLEMEGNPLNCSCENIMARDYLLHSNIHIDDVKCVNPPKFHGHSWLELKIKEICKSVKPTTDNSYLDMMMGDQPAVDAERIGKETSELKSMPLVALNDLEDGDILETKKEKIEEDEDSIAFIKADSHQPHKTDIESSGDYEVTTISDIIIKSELANLESRTLESEGILPANEHTTEDTIEGSGEGSGMGWAVLNEDIESTSEAVTAILPPLNTGPIHPYFDNDSTSEDPTPKPVTIFMGGRNWMDSSDVSTTTLKPEHKQTTPIVRDTTVSEQIRVTQAVNSNEQASESTKNITPHKTGTYVCIAIIIVLLVGLIGFAIIKGQMRKRRDRRLLRQQKLDVEKASKEMVDMNKSLLGKPMPDEQHAEKKANGKYELVPTHEPVQNKKRGENGGVGNGRMNHVDDNEVQSGSPRDSNQNKNSSKDNNIDSPTQHETSFDSATSPEDFKKDNHSLSSEDIFVPINEDDTPHLNGTANSDMSHPFINGDHTDSDYLSPSREYVPVYSPDMGRVRIKLSETQKPKTPVLVTRSRSNAGDIIITPSVDGDNPKSTT